MNEATSAENISLKQILLKIRDFIKYLRSYKVVFVIVTLTGALLGYFFAHSKPTKYVAEVTFVLEEDQSDNKLGLSSLAGQFGVDVGGSNSGVFVGDNFLALLKSRYLIKNALLKEIALKGRNITFAQLYLESNQSEKWAQKILAEDIPFSESSNNDLNIKQNVALEAIYGSLLNNDLLVDKLDKKTSIIMIKLSTTNEFFSKYFADVLTNVATEFYTETKTKKSANNLRVLQKQVDSVRKELNSAIQGVASSTDVNPNPNPSRQVLRVPSQYRQVDAEADKAILTELIKNLELSKVAVRKDTPLIQILDRPFFPLEKEFFGVIKYSIIGASFFIFLTTIILSTKKIFADIMKQQ